MGKKNRFQSNFNQNGQPVVEEDDMEENQNTEQPQAVVTEVTQQEPANAAPVVQEAPVVEEVKQPDPVVAPTVKVEEAPKDPTTIEHNKLNKNVKVEPTKQPVEKMASDHSAQAIIDKAHTATDSFTVGLVNFLDSYMKKMSPGLMVGDQAGGMTQFHFHGTLVQLFNHPDYDVFRNGMLIISAYFTAYEKGIFNERYLFRFSEQWPGGSDKLVNFHATLNLLKIIANKEERPVGKFISLERTYNTGYTELAKENITRFLKTA